MSPNGPYSSSYAMLAWSMKVGLPFWFTFVHKVILVITQGCIGVDEQHLWMGLDGLIGLINQLGPILD